MMKKYVIVATALILSACGFTPMHAPQMAGGDLAFKNIRVELEQPEDIAHNRGTFYLQQALYDRLGTSGGTHVLLISPEFKRRKLGISADDVATRYDVQLSLPYKLTDAKTGKVLDKGKIATQTTFGAPIDPYARESSEQATMQNLAKEAADRVLVRLAVYYSQAEKDSDDK